MPFPKSTKPNRHLVGGASSPRQVHFTMPASDIRRIARSLHSRAEWLEKRREPDPILREGQRREAASCRRLAAMIEKGTE